MMGVFGRRVKLFQMIDWVARHRASWTEFLLDCGGMKAKERSSVPHRFSLRSSTLFYTDVEQLIECTVNFKELNELQSVTPVFQKLTHTQWVHEVQSELPLSQLSVSAVFE
jgi:hypothetical protein